ncbi:hypothetical protein QTI17_32830 [Variovorax sp. J31P179]|uniref:hypothetical protein n=1 Tax=Variovorax sp. J31P179 TaxID=3053508 RepID=UPI002577E5D7|nr:hypothetical protein [Variovorax sp. J31P179]MDM0085386.1 hypothetical protein [Variovorax sp. J31P179]
MRTMTLLQASAGKAELFKEWLVSEFAPSRAGSGELIVNVATTAPAGLALYGSAESNSGDQYDAVIETTCENGDALRTFIDELRRDAPVSVPLGHGYAVETHTVLHRAGFEAGRPTPGYKLLRGLYLFEDLPDAAAKRMWAHHSGLATRVHVGMARYARHWVDARLTPEAPAIRGFSDLHFPDEDAMRHRYFDSERGRQEIVHDIGHFIAGGLERVFAREYVF